MSKPSKDKSAFGMNHWNATNNALQTFASGVNRCLRELKGRVDRLDAESRERNCVAEEHQPSLAEPEVEPCGWCGEPLTWESLALYCSECGQRTQCWPNTGMSRENYIECVNAAQAAIRARREG